MANDMAIYWPRDDECASRVVGDIDDQDEPRIRSLEFHFSKWLLSQDFFFDSESFRSQGATVMKPYPGWVMAIALGMICAGILPMPIVYLLRRFQVLKVDLDIHQGSIRRNETTASTKEMIDQDDDVSVILEDELLIVLGEIYDTTNEILGHTDSMINGPKIRFWGWEGKSRVDGVA